MASARVVCAIRGHAANLLVVRDLAPEITQPSNFYHLRDTTPGVAAGDLNCSDFQRLLINADVDLGPDAPFGAAVLPSVPFAFTLDLDAGAIHCPAVVCLQTMSIRSG
mgnify:CR=1 FL=1